MEEKLLTIVFGDQSVAFDPGLRCHLANKANPTLMTFFNDAYLALKSEIARLPPSQRAGFPNSSNLTELLVSYRKGVHCALDSSLVCLHQLASFIAYFSETQQYPTPSTTCLVGSCVGLLAATAVSCSKSVLDLVSLVPNVLAIAFRLGYLVQEKSKSVAISVSGVESWSSVVVGLTMETASQLLADYHKVVILPGPSRLFISAVSNGGVTVSGPPALLRQFLSSDAALKSASVPIQGLFHAPHLYTSTDVDLLLNAIDTTLLHREPLIPVFSNDNGAPIIADRGRALLRAALSEILCKQLRWDIMLGGIALSVRERFTSCHQILPFASGSIQSLAAAVSGPGLANLEILTTSDSQLDFGRGRLEDRSNRSKIAIIGFSGRYPHAQDNEAFWQLLVDGLDVHQEIPKDRFDPSLYFDSTCKRKNTSGVTKGCFVLNPGFFDARFFNMSPREAEQSDPAQRLALMTAYEAIEMAGLVPDASPSTQRDRVGVFYGTTSDDWREVNSGQNVDTYFIPGGNRAFIPGRINYHFRFSGPSYSVDTACSSSLAAIHLACNSLWRGDCDSVIAGGTNIMTNPDNFAGLDRGHFLSRTGNCNTFDDAADGYCRSDCVGTVILKRMEDAQADGDPIFGTILGAYTNHSAESVSITRPHTGAQEAIFKKILGSAGVHQSEVSYVEMHGTGTQHGDAAEMKSVLNVFAPEGASARSQALHLGSAKANIGHAESSSGVASLVKVLLMMENNTIPPHVGIKTKINRNFPTDLTERNVHIALKPTEWVRSTDKSHGRRAFVNNFSAAGGNSSLLVEDAPQMQAPSEDPRPLHMVALSAKSSASLKKSICALHSFLEEHPDLSLGSLSFTTTARRIHHNFRVMVNGEDIDSIKDALWSLRTQEKFLCIPPSSVQVGFCFTGQGSQYLGMGRQLLEMPQFRSSILQYEEIIRAQGFQPILPLLDATFPHAMAERPPLMVQLALTCLQMALGKLWKSLGVSPNVVVGHSLGEYAAMNIAGALSDVDTIYLVGTRARLLQQYCSTGTHAMLAVKAPLQDLAVHLSVFQTLDIACINGPEETVIAGVEAEIQRLANSLAAISIKVTKLNVQFAFHSGQVEPMLEAFERASKSIKFTDPDIPILSPLLGQVIHKAVDLGPASLYWSRHCRETVNFLDALQHGSAAGTISNKMTWVEIGPHPICSAMLKSTLGSRTKAFPSLRRNEESWPVLVSTLTALFENGVPIDWNEYHHGFRANLRVLRLPAYQWDLKNYWIDYVHNWCLTKGDMPPKHLAAEQVPKRFTASVQKIIETESNSNTASVLAESDLTDPDFQMLLEGHKVNGQPLCTSSAYADMALTLFNYLLARSPLAKSNEIGVEVQRMVVDKPLTFKRTSSQVIRMTASANWPAKTATFSVWSISNDRKETVGHAKCHGSFSARNDWLAEWKRSQSFIRSKIEHLRNAAHETSSSTNVIKTGMFYKLFSSLVEYHDNFKGYREAVLRSADHEATGIVKFTTTADEASKWYCSPYWIDSLGQITGFTMNANDAVDSKNQVFINHGWERMRIATPFSDQTTYQTYVKMQKRDQRSYAGDVYILDQDDIVAVYEGVTFSSMPRTVLDTVLPNPLSTKPIKAAPASRPIIQNPLELPQRQSEARSLDVEKVKAIVAQEIGVQVSELDDDEDLTNLGMDSLLSLTISDRIYDDVGIKVDSGSLLGNMSITKLHSQLTSPSGSTDAVATRPSTNSTPESTRSPTIPTPFSTPGHSEPNPSSHQVLISVARILAEEIGVQPDDLQDDMELSSFGLDSLMSLSILGRLKEEAMIELDGDFLLTHPTFGAIRESLTPSASANIQVPQTAVVTRPQEPKIPPATSVLLHGKPKSASKILWLFPDGSGLATSYLMLPEIDTDTAVYGVNSPFIKRADEMKCNFRELTAVYLKEIRRRQPHGPYFLGGWSAGGISAYDAAQSLITAGESVGRLILVDSPNPIGLEKLPPRLYHAFDKANIFGEEGKKPPSWLLPHFLAFIDVLDTYDPIPFQPQQSPQTCIIWAKDGVDPDETVIEVRPDDPREMKWLLKDRKELGPNGWGHLLGCENIAIDVLDNANHFTMMKGAAASILSKLIGRAMRT
ncbi:conidial pigment polyketide synthase PksP/Alb1 [Rhizodiscina lignyota]|uniref:Conidial pigment polyketide synthase PksP/Alb1 n=1 Tax=Rhizodiscina lignyota TaxID=1504668 RepID=A0A9P4I5E6_9PEZI|nr:conidial pigment polyketide synthase PksP/Alb1 [Rhizodiscina lignyota]